MIKVLITKTKIAKTDKYLSLFSSYRKQKLNVARAVSVINEYKAAENLLIYGLKKYYNANIDKPINVSVTNDGKPYFSSENNYPKFSISHSFGLTGIAFSDFQVGFDLQKQTSMPKSVLNKLKDKPFFENTDTEESVFKRFVMLEAKAKQSEQNLFKLIETPFSDNGYRNGETNLDDDNYFYSIYSENDLDSEVVFVAENDFEGC